jgi:hypothetical protein
MPCCLFIAAGFLGGCASTNSIFDWTHAESSKEQTAQDLIECEIRAAEASADAGAGAQTSGQMLLAKTMTERKVRTFCMQSKGYRLVK